MNKKKFSVSVSVSAVKAEDSFWSSFQELARTKIIPYQWEALNDRIEGAAKSHCMENFKIAAGLAEGEFYGCVFQDSDFAKWCEGAAYSLMWHPDSELEKTLDAAIDIVCAAQQPDGYLYTMNTIKDPSNRWKNLLKNHELYCAGHLLESAVAYFQATGKRKFLDTMIKYMDLIYDTFGTGEGQINGYPGHEVIEMALMRLYEITGDEKHLRLAKYFIDQRGQKPHYFELELERTGQEFRWVKRPQGMKYNQSAEPVREQETADGHAVRAVYLYSGMADVARATEDDTLYCALKKYGTISSAAACI